MWNKQDWHALRPWLGRLSKHRHKLLAGLCLMLLTFLAAMGLLGVSGWFITATAVTVGTLNIYVPGGAIRFFALLRTVSRYVERVVNHNFILRIQASWRVQMFSGLAHQQPLATRRYSVAPILQRLTQDLDSLDALYIRLLAPFIVAFLSACLVSLLVAVWLPLTALMLFSILLLCWCLLAFPLAERLKALADSELAASEQLRGRSLDHVSGQAEMLSWQVQKDHAAQVMTSALSLSDIQARLNRRQTVVQAVVEGMLQLLVAVTAVSALTATQEGQLAAAVAVLLPLSLLALPETFLLLPQASALWGRLVGAAARLNRQVLDESSALLTAPAGRKTEPVHVSLLGVSVYYQRRLVWQDLSLELDAGHTYVLAGPSGQGKSSLAYLLAGLATPSLGSVEINGAAPTTHWHQAVAYLTQETSLLTGTIAQNLRLADSRATESDLWRVLEMVELAERIRTMKDKLEQWTGDGGATLSGGERRRLALARVLLKDSGLVILDEPFRGVDSNQAERLWRNMEPWLAEKTVLLIAHQSGFLPPGAEVLKIR